MWRYKYSSVSEFASDFAGGVPIWWENGRIDSFKMNSSIPNSQECLVIQSYNPGLRIKNLSKYYFTKDDFLRTWFSKEVPGINLYLSESPGDRSTGTWDALPFDDREKYLSTANTLIQKSFFSVEWPEDIQLNNAIYRYFGSSENKILIESDISSLLSQPSESFEGTYELPSGGYKFFLWPDSWGSPIPNVGFRHTLNMMPIAMATPTTDPEYMNFENGWYYSTIDLPDYLGQNITYRIYRTQNILYGSLSVTIK